MSAFGLLPLLTLAIPDPMTVMWLDNLPRQTVGLAAAAKLSSIYRNY